MELSGAIAFGLLLLSGTASSIYAADIIPAPECSIAGIVEVGGGYQGGNVSGPAPALVNAPMSSNFLGFGEAAIAYGCGNWMAQVDGAVYHSGFTNNPPFFGQFSAQYNEGHVGGAISWRDPSVGRFGLAVSEVLNHVHFDQPAKPGNDIGGTMTRVGAFGDFYASDAITLGAGVFYVTGTPTDPTTTETGFEGNIHAKFYATDNISIALQGDILRSNLESGGFIDTWNGIAGSAEAEYLVPDTALSLFVGGRVARRNLDENTANSYTVNDTQGFLGVKYAFGAPVSSLRVRDRAGSYDNTSVFDEKLPGFSYDLGNAQTH